MTAPVKQMESPVINRYFKVVGGDLGAALRTQLDEQREFLLKLEGLARSVGATQVHTFAETGKFAGFSFPEGATLSRDTWMAHKNGFWIPKRRENRAFWRLLDKVGPGSVPKDVLKQFGLKTKEWMTFNGTQDFGCRLTGFYRVDVWWVIVPSRHFDIDTLRIAAEAKAEGISDTDPINMLWQPPMDWREVSQGAYLNEWEEQLRLEQQLDPQVQK